MNYAIIEDGVITNVVVLNNNASNFPNAVFLGNIPAGIGDIYENGVFYRNSERIVTMFEILQSQIAELDMALLDSTYENIMGGLE